MYSVYTSKWCAFLSGPPGDKGAQSSSLDQVTQDPKASPSHRKSATPPKVSPKPSPKTARRPIRSGSGDGSPGAQRREFTNSTGTAPLLCKCFTTTVFSV